jgi:hypothetical protein
MPYSIEDTLDVYEGGDSKVSCKKDLLSCIFFKLMNIWNYLNRSTDFLMTTAA